MTPDDAASAYHQAGHAVAALRFHFAVDLVTIVHDADTGSLGMCRSAAGLPPGFRLDAWLGVESRRILHEWAVVLLAGAGAATIGVGVSANPDAETDFHNALDLLDYASGDPDNTRRLVEEASKRTDALLRPSWLDIQRVAHALRERRTLTDMDVTTVPHWG